jgi:hypothetical protein
MKTKTKHSAYKRQASHKQAQATSNKQAKEKKGGTRPQAHTMVRGVMSH